MAKPELRIVASNPPEAAPAASPSPQQVEMPFAVINGEPLTQLPKDLYIPPQALEVFLEAFEGPLDLLLYMIRRQGLNILDIPIADITRQYMDYIGLMHEMQLELAGEYLVMAATLAEIKSRMLLPRAADPDNGEESDPRAELVRRLQQYERFKRAAESIDRLPRIERDTWPATVDFSARGAARPVPQVALQEMLLAFRDVVQRAELFAHHHVQRERLSVRERMSSILAARERSSFVELGQLFRPAEGRMGVSITFVAILEMMREGLIDIVQSEPYAPLHVRAATADRGLKLVKRADDIAISSVDESAEVESASVDAAFDDETNDDTDDELVDDELSLDDGGKE